MKILLATDGSESAETARDFVANFPFPGGSVISLLTVIDREISPGKEIDLPDDEHLAVLEENERAALEAGEKLVQKESAYLQNVGLQSSPVVRIGHPAEEIVRVVEEMEADLVVVGSHGLTGLQQFFLGSVSEKVLSHAPCSVLIVRKSGSGEELEDQPDRQSISSRENFAWKVLFAFDGSKPSRKAVSLCASFHFDSSALIEGLTVVPVVKIYRQDMQLQLQEIIRRNKKIAETALEKVIGEESWTTPHVGFHVRESANVGQKILETAGEHDTNLIFIGHKGRSGIKKFFLGSVTGLVAKKAQCAVWVVKD